LRWKSNDAEGGKEELKVPQRNTNRNEIMAAAGIEVESPQLRWHVKWHEDL
jgi:hypothetical protein